MDDSEEDFVDLCPKLLKRVRRKAGEPETQTTKEHQAPTRASNDKKRRGNKKYGDSGSKNAQPRQPVVTGGSGPGVDDAGSKAGPRATPTLGTAAAEGTEKGLTAKDKVLHRMQEFRRVGPQRMAQGDKDQVTEGDHELLQRPAVGLQSELLARDEVLALELQRELDLQAQPVEMEDVGLFFCQLCHKDLTHMSPDGRTQHLNRCLDQSEGGSPAAPLPPTVPDCPICGKKFTSPKSRAAHLKRCCSDMGVAPALLLQALQRQTAEAQSLDPAVQPTGGKRKGPPEPNLPVRKRPRKKPAPLDEDTMVALALSSSLLEQQRDREVDGDLQSDVLAPHASTAQALTWKPDAAKGRGKRKKGVPPPPPPPLLLLDRDAALRRLQERVSALLLSTRPPSPPTPRHSPSSLPIRTANSPLWQKSALQEGGPDCPSHFQAVELREYFTPTLDVPTLNKPDPSVCLAEEEAPIPAAKSQAPSLSSQAAPSPSTCSYWEAKPLSGGSQVLRDLMELGMSLSQCGHRAGDPAGGARPTDVLQSSSSILEDPELGAELSPSGFYPETEGSDSLNAARQRRSRAEEERDGHRSAALSRLTSDLSSMVNNPQLSDLQLQVDSGDLFFAHSFMVYTRCPLLAEMVHEGGFWVKEEGEPAVRRVLMNDIPGEAVLALLQFLYTSNCCPTAQLTPHLLELASRFDLQELQQLCCLQATDLPDEELDVEEERDRAFTELLRSMWNDEEETEDVMEGEEELQQEKLTEEDLEEIYQFVATQKKRQQERDSTEEEEEEETEEENKLHKKEAREQAIEKDQLLSKSTVKAPNRSSAGLQPDLSYSRLFSQSWGVCEEEQSSSSAGEKRSGRTVLQSSASVVDELPASLRPSSSLLPVPGPTPPREGDRAGPTEGRRSACAPPSPASPQRSSREPELIVLSDSGEEMNVDLAVLGSSSPSPGSPPAPEPQPAPELTEPTPEEKDCVISDFPPPTGSVLDPGSASSPEVSWLIPPTPVMPSMRSGSTQTHSSMRRTQLFPKAAGAPSSSSSAVSVPSFLDPPGGSAHVGPTVLRVEEKIQSSFDLDQGSSRPRLSAGSMSCPFLDSPLLSKSHPYSSTPLHAEAPPARPLTSDPDGAERMPLGSLCLSLSQSSPFSSSDRAPSVSQSLCKVSLQTCAQSQSSTERKRREEREGEVGRVSGEVAEEEESIMVLDEPPIAFNDSWGLNGCLDLSNPQEPREPRDPHDPVCFSLRLEDSRELSCRHGDSASSSSSSPIFPAFNLAGPPPPPPPADSPASISTSLLDSRLWDSWEEEEDAEGRQGALPLTQRLNPPDQMKTPVSSVRRRCASMVPITPMPQYSDMDTPVLKDKLSRFGVRPLPKRQMILKLKEIHQYTHQLASSDSEGEPPSAPPPHRIGPTSCTQAPTFKAPDVTSPAKRTAEEAELLSASQDSNTSNTSSTPASQDSERSNPELCPSDSDSDSDGGVSSSQSTSRLQDRLRAVRAFILSDAALYRQILRFRPLVLSQLQDGLKAAGIRLGAAKLVDYLDSQCITFTTAKPGQRRGGRAQGRDGGVRKRRRRGGGMTAGAQ